MKIAIRETRDDRVVGQSCYGKVLFRGETVLEGVTPEQLSEAVYRGRVVFEACDDEGITT